MVRAKYWVKAQEFSGQPKPEDFKLVEEELPELENGGTTFFHPFCWKIFYLVSGHVTCKSSINTACKRGLRRLCFYTCLSVILFIFCLSACWDTHPLPQEQTPPRVDTPSSSYPLVADTPLRSACYEIWATSGQYASYWNAYLFRG